MARLQKILSQAGIASRREAEELILQGRVTVDGRVVDRPGVKADIEKNDIRVDDIRLKLKPHRYILFYKPPGYLCTRTDQRGRPTIYQLLKEPYKDLFSVGRLDFDAEGLLLLTNDGDLAHNLTHPKKGIEKIYHVKVKGIPDREDLNRLRRGVPLDGRKTAPAKVGIIKRTERNTWLSITIKEGRYRQIKKMCLFIGHPVVKIKRIGLGFLRLGGMKKGEMRRLSSEEVKRLKDLSR